MGRVANHITKANDIVNARRIEFPGHGLEGVEIGVNVAENGQWTIAHECRAILSRPLYRVSKFIESNSAKT